MTRKTVNCGKDGEGTDYMRLKGLLELFLDSGEYHSDIDHVLLDTAATGVVRMPWQLLKPLIHYKLEKVINESFIESPSRDDDMKKLLKSLLDKFTGPPFTIQRLCELLTDPHKHYKRRCKFMRAIEKNLLVVSTQEPDLVWMKAPHLSQLLDPKVKDHSSTEGDKLISDTTWKIAARSPLASPRSPLTSPRSPMASPRSPRSSPRSPVLSPRSLTPPPDLDAYGSGRSWESLFESRLSPTLTFPRKRTCSLREVHIQEADSTVADIVVTDDKLCGDGESELRALLDTTPIATPSIVSSLTSSEPAALVDTTPTLSTTPTLNEPTSCTENEV